MAAALPKRHLVAVTQKASEFRLFGKASFCPPGGRSKGVTSREIYQLTPYWAPPLSIITVARLS